VSSCHSLYPLLFPFLTLPSHFNTLETLSATVRAAFTCILSNLPSESTFSKGIALMQSMVAAWTDLPVFSVAEPIPLLHHAASLKQWRIYLMELSLASILHAALLFLCLSSVPLGSSSGFSSPCLLIITFGSHELLSSLPDLLWAVPDVGTFPEPWVKRNATPPSSAYYYRNAWELSHLSMQR